MSKKAIHIGKFDTEIWADFKSICVSKRKKLSDALEEVIKSYVSKQQRSKTGTKRTRRA